MKKKGLLLINLGTPNSPEVRDVRRYLAEFLSDERVINLPAFLRYLLLYAVILPFRTRRSSRAYKKIWTEQGSPLLQHSKALAEALQAHLEKEYIVTLGMRYGHPSLSEALESLSACDDIVILPLYPQYASASTGSSLSKICQLLERKPFIPSIKIIHEFYHHPEYIQAQAELIKPYVQEDSYILFSYHGIPENQLKHIGCDAACVTPCPSNKNPHCYRSQCYETTRLLSTYLQLKPDAFYTTFQSRLGRTPWIQPYTDEYLPKLIEKNIRNLVIVCPSFTADCLETLEEIGMAMREQWFCLGGEKFELVPSLNAHNTWILALNKIIRD